MIYLDLIAVAHVAIFIVDLSGFTEAWKGLLARILKREMAELPPLHPFDCSLCMVWWSCLIYALCVGQLTPWVIAFTACLSYLSYPIGLLWRGAWEKITKLTNKLYD